MSLEAADELPACPNCGGTEFVRTSLFTTAQQAILEIAPPEVEDQLVAEHTPGRACEEPVNTSPIGPATSS